MVMKITTIQLHENTRRDLEQRKKHPKESYEEVIRRILNSDDIPSMEEMFKEAAKLKHRPYTAEELVKLSHS